MKAIRKRTARLLTRSLPPGGMTGLAHADDPPGKYVSDVSIGIRCTTAFPRPRRKKEQEV